MVLATRASELRAWWHTRTGLIAIDGSLLPAVGAVIVDRQRFNAPQANDGSTVILNFPLSGLIGFAPDSAVRLSAMQRKLPVTAPSYAPVIGMIDTGITTHDEFTAGQISCIQLDGAGNQVGTSLIDSSGHGTFVAAMIAGNASGVLPGAQLAVASVMARKPATYADCVKGLDWLAGGHLDDAPTGPVCDLINISGGTRVHDGSLARPLRELRERFGILCVAAAGNDGQQDEVDSPADYDFCLGVGSHNANGTFYFAGTDWGMVNGHIKPDICAEGVKVVSAGTASHKSYVMDTGTSYATALVSGAIGRLLATGTAAPLDPAATLAALSKYFRPLSPNTNWLSRYGRIDLAAVP